MSAVATISLYAVAWTLFGVASGWAVARVPSPVFRVDRGVFRLRPFEERGRWYDRRLRLRLWKDRLPEAGGLFRGGLSKRSLPGLDRASLQAFAAATRRAECVHWSNIGFGCTFVFWNDLLVGVLMAIFGAVVHLPFIAIQRYNRARIAHVVERYAVRR